LKKGSLKGLLFAFGLTLILPLQFSDNIRTFAPVFAIPDSPRSWDFTLPVRRIEHQEQA
jgi:hypothetical protein